MTSVWPVGEAPYVAIRAGGDRPRLARPTAMHIGNQTALFEGVQQNLTAGNDLASMYGAGAGVTAIGGATDQANAPGDPLGNVIASFGSLAVRVRETAANSVHWLRWTSVTGMLATDDFCASIYLKGNVRDRGRLGVATTGDFSAGVLEVEFDLTAQTIAYVNAGTVANIVGMGLEPVGDGWWRVWIAARIAMNSARVLMMSGASTSYTGSTAAGFDVWCGQIERGQSPSLPLLTGSRPRHAAAIPQNALLLPYDMSNTFVWALLNLTAALLTADRAPDGSFTARDFTETTATAEHRLTATAPNPLTGTVTFSVYVRPRVASGRNLIVRLTATGSGEWAECLFTIGAITTSAGPLNSFTTSGASVSQFGFAAEYLPDDWIRVRFTVSSATAGWNQVQLWSANGGTKSFTGSTGSGLHLWGAELTSGHEPTESLVPIDLPDGVFSDNGVRTVFPVLGDMVTYADIQAGGAGQDVYWEATVAAMTAGEAVIGMCRPNTADGNQLGTNPNTWAWLPTGVIQSNGGTVATPPTYAQGDTLAFMLRWNAAAFRYELSVVKNPAGSFALPAPVVTGMFPQLIPAWGRRGLTGAVAIDINFGQRPFKGIPPPGFTPLQIAAGDGARSFSSSTLPTTDAVNFRASLYGSAYPVALGRLASRPVVRRSVSCWPWGRGNQPEPVSAIALDNADGALSELAMYANRDRVLALHSVRATPFAEATTANRVAVAIVDQVRDDGGQLVITARELRDLLTVAVQDQLYPVTTVNTAVRGKPRPLALGNVRWAPVVMLNGPLLDFDVHDSANFIAIDEVRQNGALLATPADYSVPGAGGAFGFRRATAVQGKQCVRIRGQTKAGPLIIERLPDVLTWLCVTKTARLTAGQLDTAGTITTLDTAAPYTLARYVGPDDQLMASELLREIMDAYCGDLYTDSAGVLRAWRLEAPAGSPAYSWTESDLLSPVKRTADEAKGLTTTLGYGINYCVHSTGELAGAVQPTTIGSELSLPFQSRTATVTLHPSYRQAVAAKPFVTLLSDGTQAQTEIDRVAGIYTLPRAFYTAEVMLEASAVLALNPGAVVFLQVPEYDLRQGKLLRVIAIEAELASNAAKLTLWG